MTQLFSKGTINQEVYSITGLDIAEKILIAQKLYHEYKDGKADDETRYEQNFNQLFFNELLGYNRNDHMHPKAGTPVGGKIADLGLGLFREGKYNFDDVQVVVELKGAKIFLDKKQNRQNPQSPVDQGFGYKTSFKNCRWLIVSNFHQIRLYRDNKQDYEERNIADLAKGDDNFFQLRKLLILMGAKYLLSTDGESRTEKLMSQFRIDQQKITKKFYQEYKGLRLDLINDIRHKNPQLDIETIVEKAQKIIDRIVFVHFCEDKGLLPADKLKEVIDYGERALAPVWQTLKNFSEAVNSGSPKLEIPNGYNGGLFHTDEVLNNLVVGDSICKKFVAVGDYDFDDELSVNILGHIFEQSISDLEQLKIDLLGTEVETDQLVENKKQSKRKKDGIFYTPEYIVDYIVQNSLMKYLSEKEDECLAKYKDEQKAYQAYQQILQNVKVLDPACGSGAFLVKVFDVLYMENQRVGTLIGGLFDESETYKNILTNNIFGVDLNPESVEITKLSLWLKSAQKGKKLNNLDKNIKCGNSLIDDSAVAGERAFDWKKEFPQIFSGTTPTSKVLRKSKEINGKTIISETGWDDEMFGFDVIVGNPPWVTLLQSEMKEGEYNYYREKYKGASGFKLNLFPLFIEKGLHLLKMGGFLAEIIPNRLFDTPSYLGVRQSIIGFYDILDIQYIPSGVFDSVVADNVVLIIKNEYLGSDVVTTKYGIEGSINLPVKYIKSDENYTINLNYTQTSFDIIKKIRSDKSIKFLKDFCNVHVGMMVKEKSEKFKLQSLTNYNPIVEGEDLGRYSLVGLKYYDPKDVIIFGGTKNITKHQTAPKLFVRKTGNVILCSVDELGIFAEQSVYLCLPKDGEVNYKYLSVLLNSSLLTYFFQNELITNPNSYPYIQHYDLEKLPIKKISPKEQQPFIDKADQMLSFNKEFHEKKLSALALIQAEYGIEKISRKLESFWELDFADFVKALGVKSLSLDKKEELMGWFGKKKEELVNLKNTIDQVDREIDGMVYGLYGLSDEEVRVVEGG